MAPQLAVRLLRLAGTVIVTVVVVFLSVLLAVRFFIFPALDDYRGHIASALSKELSQPVAIESIAGGWDGWNPRLTVRGFSIRDRADPAAAPVLLLPRVDMTLAWTSLVTRRLRVMELAIEGPRLSIRRDAAGRFHVAGVEVDAERPANDAQAMEWLLDQREIVVRDALVVWSDELRKTPQLVLDHVTFRLEQSFGLVGSPPAGLAAPLDLRGEVTAASLRDWRDASGKFYLRFDYADVAQWREWFPVLRPVERGEGALRLWFTLAQGRPVEAVADVELTDVRARASPGLPLLDLAYLRGHLTWTADGSRRTFATRDLAFRTRAGQDFTPVSLKVSMNEGADGAIDAGQLEFDRIEVAPLSVLAEHLPFPEAWRRDLAMLDLRGSVSNGRFSWTGPPEAPVRFSGKGAFTRFGIAASSALPGAASVSGNFTFDEAKGELRLDSRDMRVSLPRVFAEEIAFTHASGRVTWGRENDALRIAAEDLRFATPHTSGNASGSWRSRPQGPGVIELRAQLARGDAVNLHRYLPLTLGASMRDWLRTAIKQGTATDIRMTLAGDLADFPFADAKKGQFLVTFKASDATLDYADGWPEVSAIDADVRFEGAGMSIAARSGRIFGVAAGPVRADIPNLGAEFPALTIEGQAAGATADFLRFVEKSPVGEWIGRFSDGAQATGNGKLALKFTLPLGKPDGVKVDGDYQFLANTLRLPGLPALSQVNGHLVFAQHAMHSRDLTVDVFGGPAKVSVASQEGGVRIDASGHAAVAALRAEFDAPLLHRVAGAADWQLRAQSRAGATSFTVESGLRGVGIDLPAPLGKAAAETVALRVERRPVAGSATEDLLTVDYRNDLRLLLHRQAGTDSSRGERALLLMGAAIARGGSPDRSGLWVRGDLPEFDVDEWLALYDKEFARATVSPPAIALQGLQVEAGRLDAFGRAFHEVKVDALRAYSEWRLRIAAREVDGTATWRGAAPSLPNGRVMARLSRFVAPGPGELHPVRSEAGAHERHKNTWPELDIASDALVTRAGHDIGKFELLAQPSGPDWRITRMALTNPAGRIDASGWWRIARDKQATELDLKVATDDAGAFLDRLGYPVAVRQAPTTITGRLSWAGAPNDFDLTTMSGDLTLHSGAGQFTRIDPGIGKLLGVLSLQSLPRRITLDFRDVFSEGFAFDDINGGFRIDKGTMKTDNLRLDGPAAQVTLTGTIDLAKETQQLDVRVKPALSSMFSAGAAALFIANPVVGAAVGAGTLLAQKLLNHPLDQMFSYDYRVTGSWSDPQVARVGSRAVTAAPPPGDSTR